MKVLRGIEEANHAENLTKFFNFLDSPEPDEGLWLETSALETLYGGQIALSF